ncbi:MAG: NAD-dependent succinate-semialdehyde dehydrogenase [Candidatus Abyssobacteria bacterium SURF_17]|uniref:NAD-dependent succinate-semialdehyde dehydrogenase n=1 Tax=Candidatus Abyssobacteria bacterium SURF_17 TaxID=2093361 RepID=A0A419EPV2_9BACT|nr:MAG: NAD-dependent succinate-semialdehyde dehydrogenase [Candidatus Abyssubacteria bacterium SURF_17]
MTAGNVQIFDILIGGEWRQAVSGKAIDVKNPASNSVVARVPQCDERDVDLAARAADKAFAAWSEATAKERARLIHAAAANVRKGLEEIGRWLTMEMGKPLADSRKEVADAASTLDYFAEEGLRIGGEIAPIGTHQAVSLVVKEPIGVCGAIAPWNYPVSLLAWKVGPALAAGCTVVCKPSTETPVSPLMFVRCIEEAGFPPGVVNAVTGSGPVVGTAIVEHPLVRKIAFTGTGSVGRDILARAAKGLKRVSLELGGHSPLLVFADAKFEEAVSVGVKRSFRNMGQICNAVNRIFVEKPLYEKYLARFVELTQKLTVGDGLENPNVDLGPMLNRKGIEKTIAHIEDAKAKGARLLFGGESLRGPKFKSELYFKPTVLADTTLDMKIMTEETFGPAVGIASFEGVEDAINLANSTEYGLVSYAYTSSLATARALARGIRSGTVCVNNTTGSTLEAPYCGWKNSGLGLELSRHALDEYMQIKHVRIEV